MAPQDIENQDQGRKADVKKVQEDLLSLSKDAKGNFIAVNPKDKSPLAGILKQVLVDMQANTDPFEGKPVRLFASNLYDPELQKVIVAYKASDGTITPEGIDDEGNENGYVTREQYEALEPKDLRIDSSTVRVIGEAYTQFLRTKGKEHGRDLIKEFHDKVIQAKADAVAEAKAAQAAAQQDKNVDSANKPKKIDVTQGSEKRFYPEELEVRQAALKTAAFLNADPIRGDVKPSEVAKYIKETLGINDELLRSTNEEMRKHTKDAMIGGMRLFIRDIMNETGRIDGWKYDPRTLPDKVGKDIPSQAEALFNYFHNPKHKKELISILPETAEHDRGKIEAYKKHAKEYEIALKEEIAKYEAANRGPRLTHYNQNPTGGPDMDPATGVKMYNNKVDNSYFTYTVAGNTFKGANYKIHDPEVLPQYNYDPASNINRNISTAKVLDNDAFQGASFAANSVNTPGAMQAAGNQPPQPRVKSTSMVITNETLTNPEEAAEYARIMKENENKKQNPSPDQAQGVIPPLLAGVESRGFYFGCLYQLHGWCDATNGHVRPFIIVSP